MLILTRKPGESLYIGDVKVTVVELKGHQVRIGIDAPPEIRIYREEIYLQILDENRKAAEAASGGGLEGLPVHWKGKPVLGAAAQAGEGGSGEPGDGQPKKPGVAELMSFSKSVEAGHASQTGSSGQKDAGPEKAELRGGEQRLDGSPLIIKRKRKKTDE